MSSCHWSLVRGRGDKMPSEFLLLLFLTATLQPALEESLLERLSAKSLLASESDDGEMEGELSELVVTEAGVGCVKSNVVVVGVPDGLSEEPLLV